MAAELTGYRTRLIGLGFVTNPTKIGLGLTGLLSHNALGGEGIRSCRTANWGIQFCRMSHTITVRLGTELAAWLEEASSKSGVAQGQIVREQLEKAKAAGGRRSFMRLAGAVSGPRTLSQRKGFSAS